MLSLANAEHFQGLHLSVFSVRPSQAGLFVSPKKNERSAAVLRVIGEILPKSYSVKIK